MDASAQIWFTPILVWVAALVFAGFAIWNGPRPLSRGFVIDRLLRYLFLFPLGIQGLWAFVGHVLRGASGRLDRLAEHAIPI